MSESFGHHILRNRYLVTGELVAASPLRVSSGVASDDTDAPLIRDAHGTVYVPGTSLRGAIRAEIERIIAGARPDHLRSCVLFTDSDCRVKFEEWQRRNNRDPLTDKQLADYARDELCDVCKLFGSTVMASRLQIADALLDKSCKTSRRDGVGIDRDTGAAARGVKFDFEVLEPAERFALRMTVENLSAQDRQLLGLVIEVLRQGLHVGGKRCAGLGLVKLEEVRFAGFASARELWSRLTSGADVHESIENWEGVVAC